MTLVAASTLLITGCAGSPAAPPTVTVTATVTAEPEAPPTPSAQSTSVLPIGQAAAFSFGTVTLHAVNLDSVPEPAPQPDDATDKWASIDVEACNTDTTAFSVNGSPWNLIATDNRSFEMSSVGYSQFPEPDYGFGENVVNPGECRRGWITFVVNKDATIDTVRYQNSEGDSAQWTLG